MTPGIKRIRAEQPEGWRLERRVPLTLIAALLVQLATLVAWAAWLEARVSAMERAAEETQALDARVARLEGRVDAVRTDVMFIRRRLENR